MTPTLRPDATQAPPGEPWGLLKPERHSYGFWTVACPTGCGSRVIIWQFDSGEAWPPYVLSGPCFGGCDVHEMAWRLAVSTGGEIADFLPPVVVTDETYDDLNALIAAHADVRDAWNGTGKFRSQETRISSLGHRLRAHGATDGMVFFAQTMLALSFGRDAA